MAKNEFVTPKELEVDQGEKYYVEVEGYEMPSGAYVTKVHILSDWEAMKVQKYDAEVLGLASTVQTMTNSRDLVQKYGTTEQKLEFENLYTQKKQELEEKVNEREKYIKSKPSEYYKTERIYEGSPIGYYGIGRIESKYRLDDGVKNGDISKITADEFNKVKKEFGEVAPKKTVRLTG